MDKAFLDTDHEAFILSVGNKKSGKTTTLIKYIIENYEKYDVFILFLPAFKNEIDNKYKFLENIPNIYIIDGKYSTNISDIVLNIVNQGFKTFFCIDDSTSINKHDIYTDKMILLISQARHMHSRIYIISHTINHVIDSKARPMIDFILIHSIGNSKLLQKSIYEEFASMHIDNYQDFKRQYKEPKWILTAIDCRNSKSFDYEPVDFNAAQWGFLNNDSKTKLTIKPINKNLKKYLDRFLK